MVERATDDKQRPGDLNRSSAPAFRRQSTPGSRLTLALGGGPREGPHRPAIAPCPLPSARPYYSVGRCASGEHVG